MYHRKLDNIPQAIIIDKWSDSQTKGEIADGVLVVEGGKMLVVAPTEAALPWSSAAVSAGGKTTTDQLTALNDWDGKTNTAAQVTHAECNTSSYASGFCNTYSRVNANGQGLTAGKWWLPSIGELMMIYANMRKINYALSVINGAAQLSDNTYWSSTERNVTDAWGLNIKSGAIYGFYAKSTEQKYVRPVSSYIE